MYILELVSKVCNNCAMLGCRTRFRILNSRERFILSRAYMMRFLCSTLIDTFSPVLVWMASRTCAKVPLPIVLPSW